MHTDYRNLLAITGTVFCSLAVIAMAFETTIPAIVLGGIAMWMITHAA